MSVSRTDKTEIESQLAVSITRDDYEPKLKSELQKYRQKAHMRGFRKGKVPMSVIRKMYGKAMLADVINELVQKELGGYLQDEELNLLGEPLPAEDQQPYDFDINQLQDFEFKFDIGRAPKFEIAGIGSDEPFEQLVVKVSDGMIDDDLNAARKRHGKEIQLDGEFEESDSITFNAKELEGDKVKNKAFETSFKVLISQIADDKLREDVLKGAKGDAFRFNIFELEKDRDEKFVRKYLLNLEEDEMEREVGTMYEGTIVEATRIGPADLNEEFFTKAFGEDVKTEDAARDLITNHIHDFYERQSEALLFRDFQNRLLEVNNLDLPDDFLQRWLRFSNKDLSESQLQQEYPDFAKNLTWSLIERRIIKDHELEVSTEEVRETMQAQLLQYMGNYPIEPDMMKGYVDRMMGDREQVSKVYQEKLSDKVFEKLQDLATIKPKPIELEEFKAIIEQANAERQKAVASSSEEE